MGDKITPYFGVKFQYHDCEHNLTAMIIKMHEIRTWVLSKSFCQNVPEITF